MYQAGLSNHTDTLPGEYRMYLLQRQWLEFSVLIPISPSCCVEESGINMRTVNTCRGKSIPVYTHRALHQLLDKQCQIDPITSGPSTVHSLRYNQCPPRAKQTQTTTRKLARGVFKCHQMLLFFLKKGHLSSKVFLRMSNGKGPWKKTSSHHRSSLVRHCFIASFIALWLKLQCEPCQQQRIQMWHQKLHIYFGKTFACKNPLRNSIYGVA